MRQFLKLSTIPILREIKTCWALMLVFLGKFQFLLRKFAKNQNSGPFFPFYQIWFHEKSERQENSYFLTLSSYKIVILIFFNVLGFTIYDFTKNLNGKKIFVIPHWVVLIVLISVTIYDDQSQTKLRFWKGNNKQVLCCLFICNFNGQLQ